MLKKLFLFCEMLLYVSFFFADFISLKYLSIVLCFFYTLNQGRERLILAIILMADYCLLLQTYYHMGVFLFIVVQYFYHYFYFHKNLWYLVLISLIGYHQLVFLSFIYLFFSLINIITAYKQHHWLIITLLLLALCDINVALQYIMKIKKPMIWIFYLPSQVYFVLKTSKDKSTAS